MRTVSEGLSGQSKTSRCWAHRIFSPRGSRSSRAASRASASSTFAISQSPKYVLECVTVACLVAVALYLRSRVAATGPWVGQLTFVGLAAYRLLPALQQAFTAIVNIRTDRAAFASVEMDLDRPTAPGATVARRYAGSLMAWPRHEVRLCEVSFRYSPEHPPVLSDVSLVIPAGAIVGFKGANGSGKTTLLDLVSGLLEPQSGHIEVDGIRLQSGNYRSGDRALPMFRSTCFCSRHPG